MNKDVANEESGLKMHEVVENYAKDNSLFIKDFASVFQKMLQNGYQEGNSKGNEELKDTSWDWINMRCNKGTCRII